MQIDARPAGMGPLEVVLALEAPGYEARLEAGRLVLANGHGRLYFEGLKAWDACGFLLPVRLVHESGRLIYRVDDAQARYPVTIDPTFVQQAYVKASNTGAGDWFGWSVALSGDGNTLAVGARLEDSSATGVDGDESNNSAFDSGAVYVFVRSGAIWSQQAYIKASNTEEWDVFGSSVALSSDGNTLAVGAPWEDSNATGVNGDQSNDSASGSGAVYVFTLTHTLGGTVSGLSGGSVTLLLNGGAQTVTVSANGSYSFPNPVAHDTSYTVTVSAQPVGQTCTVPNASGTATANVTNINVSCSTNTYTLGGTVSGLSGGSVTLSLNGGAQTVTVSANGSYSFPNPVAHGTAYTVTVSAQPTGQTCTVSNASGTATSNVTSVNITCVTLPVPAVGPAGLVLLGLLLAALAGLGLRMSIACPSKR
ncbi:MAG: hypothetical protein N3F11_08645 [Casimicrobiaceae bacterium]|nr:hypothetical protein [Casimicrobiaceae bacterium]